MQATVPFVHGLIDAQASAWLEAMRSAAPDLDFRFLSDVSAQERKEVEVAVVANPEPATLAELPKLKWVQSLWAGVDRILREMPDPSVQIVRLIDPQLGETMAEAVLAWTLYLHRDMPRYAALQRDRLWVQHDLPTAAERSVGLLGLRHLGQSAADRLKTNGFPVQGWSRSTKQIPGVATFAGADGLAEIARTSDILVVLLPSTPQTRGLLGHGFFCRHETRRLAHQLCARRHPCSGRPDCRVGSASGGPCGAGRLYGRTPPRDRPALEQSECHGIAAYLCADKQTLRVGGRRQEPHNVFH